MPKNQTLSVLSIGNIISAGLRIYRDHFNAYFNIALQAYLWVIIPIYGWAKFCALSALIGRLAYYETVERPEAISQARPIVERKMWSFLGQALLINLILVGVILGGAIFLVILKSILGNNSLIIGFIIILCTYFWVITRIFISSLPLAIENNMTATAAINRSWTLTKGSVLRILGIIFLLGLITIPLAIIFIFVMGFISGILAIILGENSGGYKIISTLMSLAMNIIYGSLFLPLGQSINGVIYYDLLARREASRVKH